MSDGILFETLDGVARVVLNRPDALNALTLEMALALDARLRDWQGDPSVRCVLIRGQGSRAFCAGGDIRRLYDERDGDYPRQFYRAEYRLNARLHRFAKPYIAFLDGIVMGGGVGVSVHGSHRVATEHTMFAMPETGIGLFPDVGGSYFLSRCPGALGMYLGLTGARLGAADAIYCGIAQNFMASRDWDALRDTDNIVGQPIEPPNLAAHRALIDRCFAKPSVEEILACACSREEFIRRRNGGDPADQVADQPQDRASANPRRARSRLRRLHADGMAHGQSRHRGA